MRGVSTKGPLTLRLKHYIKNSYPTIIRDIQFQMIFYYVTHFLASVVRYGFTNKYYKFAIP